MALFKVATFAHERKNGSKWFTAYTRDYSEQWEGCRIYHVEASSGSEAKRIAIANRKIDEARAERKDA
jgi:hypothetical protein